MDEIGVDLFDGKFKYASGVSYVRKVKNTSRKSIKNIDVFEDLRFSFLLIFQVKLDKQLNSRWYNYYMEINYVK